MNRQRIPKKFFSRRADVVARDLLGKILCRKIKNKILYSKIVETEAYFGEEDFASWARFGKRKDNCLMWEDAGKILIKNVHKYKMLNFITGKKGKAEAVLIRAVEPLNFDARTSGPGLLTNSLFIEGKFNGKDIFNSKEIYLIDSFSEINVEESFRVGVSKDLEIPLRFYIKGNSFVSRK